jgi:hypothetical protein
LIKQEYFGGSSRASVKVRVFFEDIQGCAGISQGFDGRHEFSGG